MDTKENTPKYESKKLKGYRYDAIVNGKVIGEYRPTGYGVFNNELGKFWASSHTEGHPADYPRASTTKEIARQFNEYGPSAELEYVDHK